MTYLKKLSRIGTGGVGDRRSFRRIVLCNQIAMAIAAFTLAYNLLYAIYAPRLLFAAIILNFLCILLYGAVLRLNARGRHRLAGRVLLAGGSLQIFLLVWLMSTDCGLQLYLFGVPALAILIFSKKETGDTAGCSLFAISLFFASHILFSGTSSVLDLGSGFLIGLYFSSAFGSACLIGGILYFFHLQVEKGEEALEKEHARSESLLLNILPAPVAEQLKADPAYIAEEFPDATVLFADITGFTALSGSMSPGSLVMLLNDIFSRFDDVAERFGLEKIKTIGDAYMLVGGLPLRQPGHAGAVARAALEILAEIEGFNKERNLRLSLRIGMHSGPVVAGVIGHRKFAYDIWGQTVNIASRLESQGSPGKIHTTASVRETLKDRYRFSPSGPLTLRGVGEVETCFLERAIEG